MKRWSKSLLSYTTVIAMAVLLAANYHLFVVENQFAPAGLGGIATMVQYVSGFSIGYLSLIINIPLCAAAFFLVSRGFAAKSMIFAVVYSFVYLFLQQSGWDALQYDAGGHDTIFPAIISGVISGLVNGLCFRNNASTGGTDVVAKYINKVRPGANFFAVTFVLNALIAIASLFVFSENGGIDYKPVALCITYCFVSTFVGNYIIKGGKTAYKFTVITSHADELTDEITHILRHGATRLEAHGAYTGKDKTVLLCVVNKHQLTDFKALIDKYDDTFSFYELVNETYGNFKHVRH